MEQQNVYENQIYRQNFFLEGTLPEKYSKEIKTVSALATYGWGMIPVRVQIGKTEFTTSLFPKDSKYLVPLKVVVRKAEKLSEGDKVTIQLEIVFK